METGEATNLSAEQVSLLMRDGNYLLQPHTDAFPVVVSLPMRDGNVPRHGKKIPLDRCYLPMRDGNTCLSAKEIGTSKLKPTYEDGNKTDISKLRGTPVVSLPMRETYLRNTW